jgi:membrane-bound lytic murein transglycosylase F
LQGAALAVIGDSAHAEMIEELRRHGHSDVRVQRVEPATDPVDLLARLESGDIAYAVADSHQVQLAQQYYPSLAVAFELGPPQRLCWAFPVGREDALFRSATQFFVRISGNGELTRIAERYYGHLGMLSYQDVSGLLERRLNVMPRYVALFKRAQLQTGFDWRLLAALAYQESKWDPQATSVTGVRGIMMLTADTADALGVSNRLDPQQAIPAAARYLGQLIDALPPRVMDPDRLWLGLAAYNVGATHLEDARMLAQRQGLNPASWVDVKRMLPSLANPQVFSDLKAGFARGAEPVSFVDSVRGYYDILRRFEPEYQSPLASSLSATSPR